MEIMMTDKEDKIIEELFDSVKNRYQNNLESVENCEFDLQLCSITVL